MQEGCYETTGIGGSLAFPFIHVGLATNNMAEMVAVRQGLEMAWNMGSKYLQLEMDSKVVLTWLTNTCVNYPINMMPLICDCRNLLVLECSTCIVKRMAVRMS